MKKERYLISGEWFRSTDLRVMSPPRFPCATPLFFTHTILFLYILKPIKKQQPKNELSFPIAFNLIKFQPYFLFPSLLSPFLVHEELIHGELLLLMGRKSLLSRVPKREYSNRAPVLRDLKQLADLVLKEPADPASAEALVNSLEHHVCGCDGAVHTVPGLAAGHKVVDISAADNQHNGSFGDKLLPLADVLEHGAGLGVLDADNAGKEGVAGSGGNASGFDHTLDLLVLHSLVSPATDAASLVQFGDDAFHLYLFF